MICIDAPLDVGVSHTLLKNAAFSNDILSRIIVLLEEKSIIK